ncbi:hypothetical protein MHYP_G00312960 [Metynnis hypsauchen]
MATLARQQLSLDSATFSPGSRSPLTDAAESQPADDMNFSGPFPTCEDFSLVCNVCTQVVKPQGFLTRYGECTSESASRPKERDAGVTSSSLLVPLCSEGCVRDGAQPGWENARLWQRNVFTFVFAPARSTLLRLARVCLWSCALPTCAGRAGASVWWEAAQKDPGTAPSGTPPAAVGWRRWQIRGEAWGSASLSVALLLFEFPDGSSYIQHKGPMQLDWDPVIPELGLHWSQFSAKPINSAHPVFKEPNDATESVSVTGWVSPFSGEWTGFRAGGEIWANDIKNGSSAAPPAFLLNRRAVQKNQIVQDCNITETEQL